VSRRLDIEGDTGRMHSDRSRSERSGPIEGADESETHVAGEGFKKAERSVLTGARARIFS
jgi:hypothetical protein